MNICICLDDKNGIMFNNRRQSRDIEVINKILAVSENRKLWMNEYSAKLFPENADIIICEDFLDKAAAEDFAFAEKGIASLENAEKLYIFLWNRRYPADVYFEFSPESEGFILKSTEEFAGKSHEKITLNIYERV